MSLNQLEMSLNQLEMIMEPGDKLKNGATVVAVEGQLVVAWTGREYVVWQVDSEGNAFWGYYPGNGSYAEAEDLTKAVECLLHRAGKATKAIEREAERCAVGSMSRTEAIRVLEHASKYGTNGLTVAQFMAAYEALKSDGKRKGGS